MTERFSGRTGFILSAIASAVGLGSIWKFPYEVGANGGAVFIAFYVAGLVLAVVPLMFAELAIGRRGAGDATTSLAAVAKEHRASAAWRWAGVLGVVTAALILSFYSVIGGWTLAYAAETAWRGLGAPDGAQARYDALLAAPVRMAAWHFAFMAVTAAVVARGIAGGVEASARVLMPLLAVLMVALAAYALATGDAAAALGFLFRFDSTGLDARAALDALGLGFFSIGVGFGLMITYAAYAGRDIDLGQAAIVSVAADTAISLLAGLAVFPLVFANGLDPAGGPGLVFVTLPLAFARMPFGGVAALGFYVLLFVAALASAISMLELGVSLLVQRRGWPRRRAAWTLAAGCFVLGLGTVLSFNLWKAWQPTFFDFLDQLTSNVLLPAGGLAVALFAGWKLPATLLGTELGLSDAAAWRLRFVLRWVTPVLIVAAAAAGVLF